MNTLTIRLPEHQTAEVEGTMFQHPVAGLRFSFFLHKAYDKPEQLCVSHVASGCLVTQVTPAHVQQARGDQILAARDAVDMRAALGAEKLRSALLTLENSLKRSPV